VASTKAASIAADSAEQSRTSCRAGEHNGEASPNTQVVSCRDVLKVHPAADLFPMMPADELKALGEDIKKHGLREPIILYEDMILDGRNRYRACIEAGVVPTFRLGGQWPPEQINLARPLITDPYAYVISANIHRRHLTPDQKRDLIGKLLKATPEKSNRQIAEQVKADHKTVGSVRETMEGRGEIPHVDERADTKGRKQPAKKKVGVRGDEEATPSTIDAWLPLPEGYARQYEHWFAHGECHLLPKTKDYEGPEWQQWRTDHPRAWKWRLRKAVSITPLGFEPARDKRGNVIRPGPWLKPDASVPADRAGVEAKKKVGVRGDDPGVGDATADDLAAPNEIEDNVLYVIQRINENARASNKLLRASALDREAAERISTAIERMIQKWRSIQSTLARKDWPADGAGAS
jgi:hypothetical protein